MPAPKPNQSPRNSVRIIGGKWRGRKLQFTDAPGLRPTPDRVRETLFNWLAPVIHGAHCLDAFAGSGALGFEALSRGATSVTFVECAAQAFADLKTNCLKLNAERVTLIHAPFPQLSPQQFTQPFDIVFLDPPFEQDLIRPACEFLNKHRCLAENALIYLETETHLQPLPIPQHWEILRSKTAGAVNYALARNSNF